MIPFSGGPQPPGPQGPMGPPDPTGGLPDMDALEYGDEQQEYEEPSDPSAILPGSEPYPMDLEDRIELGAELYDIIDAYTTAMRPRYEKLDKIDDAYNLVQDFDAAGTGPNSAQVISELLRSHVNTASARVTDMMMSTDPFWEVTLTDSQADDAEEKAEEARATEKFLHAYLMFKMRAELWLPMAAHRATKQGAAVLRVPWVEKTRHYKYKDANGRIKEYEEDYGCIDPSLIGNRQFVFWPVDGLSLREGRTLVGHTFFLTPSQWRSFAAKFEGITEEMISRVADAAPHITEAEEKRGDESDLEGKGIEIKGLNPFKGEIQLYELWLMDYYLPGDSEPGNYRVFWWGDGKEVLFIEENPLWSQNHPYFLVPYWLEDNSIWPTGAGHEILQNQKIDAALWNYFLDTLRITANHIRVTKAGSMAESMADAVGPGENLVTEKPDEDFSTVALGSGDGLNQILSGIERNDFRAGRSTTVTPIEMGQGDPTLKSGASPGSYAQLREGSGGKFRRVDQNMRIALSDLGLHVLELLQQYAPDSLYYDYVSRETADRVMRQKFKVPHGKLRERFRLRVRAASATSNQEVRKTNLMALYQMTIQHTNVFVQMVDLIVAPADPARAQRLKEQSLRFLHSSVYKQLVEEQELQGMAASLPEFEQTPDDAMLNGLVQQATAELQQQVQLLQQQVQQLMGAGQAQPQGALPGGPPSPPPAAPPV